VCVPRAHVRVCVCVCVCMYVCVGVCLCNTYIPAGYTGKALIISNFNRCVAAFIVIRSSSFFGIVSAVYDA